ncbi:MAG TPA: hypothetical protein VMT85_16200 [Thermoanaerobaculia bacterium]|nr:hypothetical protein [Thermoanaerobaculia bacterium]
MTAADRTAAQPSTAPQPSTARDPRILSRPNRALSRRSAITAGGLMLGGCFVRALAQEGGLMLPVGDLARLVRRLLSSRREGVRASKRVRLTDPDSGRKASLLIADDGTGTLALLLTFTMAGEPLHVHTVSVALDDGESLFLELFRVPPEGRDNREIVGARLELADLERLAAAVSVTVTARGWDESFVAILDAKELDKIRRFHEKREGAPEEDEEKGWDGR